MSDLPDDVQYESGDEAPAMSDERRPIDHVDDAVGVAAEAAELAEHIRDSNPQHRREELLDQLITMIDDAHESALTASVRLDDA